MFNRSKLENEMGKLARQSGKLLETGKLKLQITQLGNDIYNLKAELGNVVFQAFENQGWQGEKEVSEIEEICRRVAELEQQSRELEAQAAELNSK